MSPNRQNSLPKSRQIILGQFHQRERPNRINSGDQLESQLETEAIKFQKKSLDEAKLQTSIKASNNVHRSL